MRPIRKVVCTAWRSYCIILTNYPVNEQPWPAWHEFIPRVLQTQPDTLNILMVIGSWLILLLCPGKFRKCMMTSSNGNIFRVTGPLCGEFTGPGEFPTQRPVTWSFGVFFDLRLNKRLRKQPWGWWFETPSWSLWRQCYAIFRSLRVPR